MTPGPHVRAESGGRGPIFVLSGGPCAGKTTLIDEIRRRGWPVIPEAAREVILEGKLHPGLDILEFQEEVLRRQVAAEAARPPGPVFSDRGIGDHFGYVAHYGRARGVDVAGTRFAAQLEAAWEEARRRYRAVFILEQSPLFSRESYRRESAGEARAIHAALEAAYRARHTDVRGVPWEPLGERAERILRAVREILGEPATSGPSSPGAPRS
jgi:predicted ATPase